MLDYVHVINFLIIIIITITTSKDWLYKHHLTVKKYLKTGRKGFFFLSL